MLYPSWLNMTAPESNSITINALHQEGG